MSIIKKLQAIQSELEVPKSQYNSFGKYHYRNAEDILAAAKPICIKHGCLLTVTDDMVALNDRFYVKAVARLRDGEEAVETTAYAREELTKKGMDAAQITGAASSYARKYALNGLFCIDDVKDADHSNGKTESDKPEYTKLVNVETLSQIADRADQVGMSKDELRQMMKDLFSVSDSRKLTVEQAAELDAKLIERLEVVNA